MVSGGIVADGDDRLTTLLEEELGTRIVVEDHCTGVRPFWNLVPEELPPLRLLQRRSNR